MAWIFRSTAAPLSLMVILLRPTLLMRKACSRRAPRTPRPWAHPHDEAGVNQLHRRGKVPQGAEVPSNPRSPGNISARLSPVRRRASWQPSIYPDMASRRSIPERSATRPLRARACCRRSGVQARRPSPRVSPITYTGFLSTLKSVVTHFRCPRRCPPHRGRGQRRPWAVSPERHVADGTADQVWPSPDAPYRLLNSNRRSGFSGFPPRSRERVARRRR